MTLQERKAMELALDALKQSQQIIDEYMTECVTARQANNEAITVIKEALAQRTWVGLDDTDLAVCDTDGVMLAKYWERVLREKNT